MLKKQKVALIGVGGISGAHIPVWEQCPEAELVALCDVRPEQMSAYGNLHCYTDFETMLAHEQIDILDICLPTYLHVSYAIRAMEAGIHVLCEKPISLHKEDVQRVYQVAKENHVCFMVAHVLRFWPEYLLIKTLYEQGTYGRLLSASMSRMNIAPNWSFDDWMLDEARSGFVPYDLHIHDLDFLVYAFGAPKKVTSHRCKRPEQDYLRATYEYDGFFVSAEASWFASPYPFRAGFLFQFEHAVAALEQGRLTIYEQGGGSYCPVGDSESVGTQVGVPAADAYGEEIRYFLTCVTQGRAPDRIRAEELETVIDILNAL